jgi:hypothetical protein
MKCISSNLYEPLKIKNSYSIFVYPHFGIFTTPFENIYCTTNLVGMGNEAQVSLFSLFLKMVVWIARMIEKKR